MAPIKYYWFRADDGAILASADYTCSFLVFAYTVNTLYGIGFGTGVYIKHLDVFSQAMPSAIAIGEFREKRIAGIAIPMAEALQQSYQFSAHKSIDKIFAIKNFVQKDDFSRRVF
ncbi:hypothetical protein MMC11_009085 [Xylographa trunciseda]|nr:hypothetical protein [Xylographa trunciseda]